MLFSRISVPSIGPIYYLQNISLVTDWPYYVCTLVASLTKPPAGFLLNIHFTNCHRFFVFFCIFSKLLFFCNWFVPFCCLLYFCAIKASINISPELKVNHIFFFFCDFNYVHLSRWWKWLLVFKQLYKLIRNYFWNKDFFDNFHMIKSGNNERDQQLNVTNEYV